MAASAGASFSIGDVVRLRSGGPQMTVHGVSAEAVSGTWFKGLTVQAAIFQPETLAHVTDEAAPKKRAKK